MELKFKNTEENKDVKLHFLKWVIEGEHRKLPNLEPYLDLVWVGLLKKYGDTFFYSGKHLLSITELDIVMDE